jgi:hypothetical protein
MSELDHTDALAAEYVLGTLDFEERAQARTLRDADEAFAAKVELWERRFGELHLMVEPVEPDSKIWARIKAKMSEVPQQGRLPQLDVPPPAPAAAPAEPPSLDAIEAAISAAATTLTSEATAAAAAPENSAGAAPETPPPTSDMIPAPAPDATVTPAPEATTATPVAEATSATPALEATAASASEATSAPISQALPTSTSEGIVAQASAIETMSGAPAVPPSVAALQPPSEAPAPGVEPATAVPAVHRRLRRWRAFAILMTLVVIAVAALVAAWRFAPDRVPPMLQPVELMRHLGVALPAAPAPRRPPPPESQFDE